MAKADAKPQRAVIVSASSDIGAALARRWLARGWDLAGTYRTPGPVVDELATAGMGLVPCDLADSASTRTACRLLGLGGAWDVLVLCPGRLDPVGPFPGCDFDEWEESVRVNLTGPLRLLHGLLASRRPGGESGPCVLLFAGGGTNAAPVNYSAYTLSKVSLIKACELLDAEVPDTRFVILGTGWVKTKIHEATLRAGAGPAPTTSALFRSSPETTARRWKRCWTAATGRCGAAAPGERRTSAWPTTPGAVPSWTSTWRHGRTCTS